MTDNRRPYIVCFMESSIDGRLKIERYSKSFYKQPDDFAINEYMRIGSDELKGEAMLFGRTTYYQDFCKNLYDYESHKTPASKFEPFKGKHNENHFYTIVMDSKGMPMYDEKLLQEYDFISILSETVSDDYLNYLRSINVSYIFAGNDGRDIEKALNTLHSLFGLNRILLEGGGTLNRIFLKLKLIDEITLFIVPSIDGMACQPSVFECPGDKNDSPSHGQSLEFQRLDPVISIFYKKK